MNTIVIAGCGDIGHRVARKEMAEGFGVFALARSRETEERLRTEGIKAVTGDLDRPGSLRELSTAGCIVYYFAPPPAAGITDPRIANFLSAIRTDGMPERVVLISTTGVYGDCGGEWVTEERPPRPLADRARRRLDAEQALLGWGSKHAVPVVILRVAGIYGPGRLPEARLRSGEPVLKEDESPFSNRIHADDLATVCFAAARRATAGAVYNVSDGRPTTMTDYFYRVADLLKIPRPPAISLEEARGRMSAGMLSYLRESKRIDNRKMIRELAVGLAYPDLASGLPSCVGPPAEHWVRSHAA